LREQRVLVLRRVRRGQLVSQEQGRAQVLPELRASQVLRGQERARQVQPGLPEWV